MIKRYFKKKRLLKKYKKEISHYGNISPYSHSYDLRVWQREVYERAIRRLNGEKVGEYMFESTLQEIRDTYGPKLMSTEEKEYREYLNDYITKNIIPTIKAIFKGDSPHKKKERENIMRELRNCSKNPEYSLEEYLEMVDPYLAGDYMDFKQWKREINLNKILDK